MSELRLAPAALLVWAALLLVHLGHPAVGFALVAASSAAAWGLGHRGQAVVLAACGAAAVVVGAVRAGAPEPGAFYSGTVTGRPRLTEHGTWVVSLLVPGLPVAQPLFVDELPPVEGFAGLPPGSAVTGDGTRIQAAAPTGWSAFAARVSERFRAAVEDSVGPSSQGLIPGMVLGDVSLQTQAEQDVYVAAGLSHLSAVSGANISLVTSAAAVALRAVGVGPRAQVAGALAAMAVFVGLVGPEPSVLRASVAGVVGLLAVVGSTRMQPAHALSLGALVLLFVRSDLAVNFGFALSMAATAGIVGLFPLLFRAIAPLGLPDVLGRALAVAVAADVVTMPIVALMTGEVSLVSVLANVLVAPATAPVTVLGLGAVVLAQFGLAGPLLRLIEPCTWWIFHIAHGATALPLTTVAAGPLAVLVVYGWLIFGLTSARPRLTIAIAAAALLVASWHPPEPAPDYAHPVVVPSDKDIGAVPPGTTVIVVERGSPRDYPVRTQDGIDVVYAERGG